jgi:glycosyltransferase involved in cell wall biosynthesis
METRKPTRNPRIGIVTDGLVEHVVDGEARIANGGVGVYIYQLVKHLLEVDYSGEFVLMRHGQGYLDIYRHPRVRAVFFATGRPKALHQAFDRDHRRVAREFALDLIHYPNQFGGIFLPRSIRRVVTLHDLTPLLFPSMHPRVRVLAYKLGSRLALRRADRIMVDSDHTGKDLIAFQPDCAKRVVTVYPGVGAAHSTGGRDPSFLLRKGLQQPYILTVGVLEPRKNHVLLLTALGQLVASGHDLDLVIIGRQGWHWVDPRTRGEYQPLTGRVRILEDVADHEMVEYYRHAAVFAYPSWYEGFGLPVLEAMACGTPVVCSNTSSLPEAGGTAALYADPHDPAAFVAQIVRVLRDGELRGRMVASGLQRAQQLSWRRTALAVMEVYRSAVSTDRGSSGQPRSGGVQA